MNSVGKNFPMVMDLANYINSVAPLESESESDIRNNVTNKLQSIANRWLHSEDPSITESKLLTFGSSILGVVTNGSDLDTVLLLPSSISKEKFFSNFSKFLRSNTEGLTITSMMAVPDAHVPVLKMVANGLPVDILPCQISAKDLNALLASSHSHIDFKLIHSKDLNTPSLLALNGVRVGQTLIDSIAAGRVINEDEQVDTTTPLAIARLNKFKLSLRFIKYWAKQRGIYSNIMGYFGGVTWAILLVKSCLISSTGNSPMMDQSDDVMEIVCRFFQFCHTWSWGVGNPISLKPLPNGLAQYLSTIRTPNSTPTMSSLPSPDGEDNGVDDAVVVPSPSSMWDPSVNDSDKKSLMPVLTPIAPYMNSTFNVLVSTQRILIDEFRRASDLCRECRDVAEICSPHEGMKNFSFKLPIHLHVTPEAGDERKRLLFVWKSLVESKLRVLLFHLERIDGVVCRPVSCEPNDDFATGFAILMSFVPSEEEDDENGKRIIDLNPAVSQFHGALSTTLQSRKDKDEIRRFCRLEIVNR